MFFKSCRVCGRSQFIRKTVGEGLVWRSEVVACLLAASRD